MADRQKNVPVENPDSSVDASINARLNRHLMDNAVKAPVEDEESSPGLWARMMTAGGIAFLMSVIGLFSLMDRKQRFL